MNKLPIHALTLLALAAIAGCSTLQADNAQLQEARNDYLTAQNNPQARDLAPSEMKLAGEALAKANDAWAKHDNPAEVSHLAYLAKQQTAVAQEAGKQKASELAITNANAARDKMRLAARTNEADAAKLSAEAAQRQAESAQRGAEASQRQADASRQQTMDAQARTAQLEAQLNELNAKKTERGMVITIGDVLFDTNKSQLKSGGLHSVEKLGGFLRQNPQHKALVEGFTDSVGSNATNMELSGRRADAVRMALVGMGIGGERVAARGYGEQYPVAGNDSMDGRQLNRRVEIVLSDANGVITPR